MRAIFKREMRAYFASPVGYVVVAALLAGAAWRWRDSFALGLDSSYYAKRQP